MVVCMIKFASMRSDKTVERNHCNPNLPQLLLAACRKRRCEEVGVPRARWKERRETRHHEEWEGHDPAKDTVEHSPSARRARLAAQVHCARAKPLASAWLYERPERRVPRRRAPCSSLVEPSHLGRDAPAAGPCPSPSASRRSKRRSLR